MWSDEALLRSLLGLLGLESCSGVATPGVKAEQRIENEDPLDEAGVAMFRTCLGKLLFLVGDRADCQFATKEVARAMRLPTKEAMVRLKRNARYMRTTEDIRKVMAPTMAKTICTSWSIATGRRTRRIASPRLACMCTTMAR